jgi:uncharacterized protein YqgC (DUF456 family)
MDTLLLIVGLILMILGLIGSFLPVLPGPTLSWFGFVCLYFTKTVEANYWVLGITFLITIFKILSEILETKTAEVRRLFSCLRVLKMLIFLNF